jgi:hypothetical protein
MSLIILLSVVSLLLRNLGGKILIKNTNFKADFKNIIQKIANTFMINLYLIQNIGWSIISKMGPVTVPSMVSNIL